MSENDRELWKKIRKEWTVESGVKRVKREENLELRELRTISLKSKEKLKKQENLNIIPIELN